MSLEPTTSAAPSLNGSVPGKPKATHRNFIAALIDVVGFWTGTSFLAPQAVLQEFMTHLTRSNVVIGLSSAIAASAVSLTQLFVANFVERLPIKKWYVMVVATGERFAILLLAILTPFLAISHPTAMVVVLLALLALHYLLMGCSMPAYSAMITKVIPARQRGKLYGLGGTIANVVIFGTGFLVPILVTRRPDARFIVPFQVNPEAWWRGFPNGYALCFFLGFVILMVSYLPLAFIDEPRENTAPLWQDGRAFRRRLVEILRERADFRFYLYAGVFYNFALAGMAFYVKYALDHFNAPAGVSGRFLVVMSLGAMSSVVWGLLADRTNNRTVLLIAGGVGIVSSAWALAAPSLDWFYPVVFLAAVSLRGVDLGGYNLQLEFAPPSEVPRYVALSSAFQFLPRLVGPLIGGVLADRFGFQAVFLFTLGSGLLSLVTIARMVDPRGRVERGHAA